MRSLSSTLAASLASLLAGACGDDGGGGGTAADTGSGTAAGTAGDDDGVDDGQTNAGPTTADSTGTPDPTDATGDTGPVDPTGGVDTTGGDPVADASFRFNSLTLVDPHMYAVGGVLDITDTVNGQFNDGLNMDAPDDKDDFYDLGLALLFRPLDTSDGFSGDVDFANADCLAPDGAMCDLQAGSMLFPTTYDNVGMGACLAADPTHLTAGYDMPVGPTGDASGACFTTAPADIELVTSSVTIPLSMAQVSAKYVGTQNLASGLVRGFITNEVAMNTMVMTDVISGPLSDFLQDEDRDEDGTGWWFYLHFTALEIDWTGA
jgi:hypothetical protein